jgi:hypothetical protein
MSKSNVLLFASIFILSANIFAGNYYCPRTNLFLEHLTNDLDPKGLYSSGMEGIDEPFPRAQADIGKEPNYGRLNFETKICSTEDFECIKFTQNRNLFQKESVFYLFMPRVVELGKEYSFKGMRLFTNVSHTAQSGGSSRAAPIIQATIWQKIGEVETPMKLTIENKRGVIFWDGVDFWNGRYNVGETCILQSKKGFFLNVSIKNWPKK